MTAHCSDRRASIVNRLRSTTRSDESGAIIVFMAVALVVMLGSAGLAIDLGRGYLTQVRLSRAVDASALAAAKSLRRGQTAARAAGTAVSTANGVVDGAGGATLAMSFGTNARGENTVTVTGSQRIPTTFMRVLGHYNLDVGAAATAAVPPVDLVLVLDQSGSLERADAWDDLQSAATSFIQYFDDSIDQLGLVSYQLSAAHRVSLQHNFTSPITSAIAAMQSAGDTNTGEGLRFAQTQMGLPAARPSAAKVVVFFTDGRPTALRGFFGGQDRALAVYTTGSNIRGYFNNPDNLPLDQVASANGCVNRRRCFGLNENAVRSQARTSGLQMAASLRQQNTLIYTIGLGDPTANDPLLVPDLNYLRDLANEGGRLSPDEPQGRMFFAPTAADLQTVFDLVAQDLLVRLAN